jgi:uncharacterized protein YyaL (SSP411 family)
MDTTSYADARVASLVAERLVPVRIDADRRPDVNDRYNLDGWPTTVLLTPSGEMLTGTTYLPADGLLAMLEDVTAAYASGREDLERRAEAVSASRRAQRRMIPPASDPDLSAPSCRRDRRRVRRVRGVGQVPAPSRADGRARLFRASS